MAHRSMAAALRARWMRAALVLAVVAGLAAAAGAQTRFTYSRGQSVSPAYEGWWPNDDGSYTLFFGYMNSNWVQELDVPIGPENNIEPGGPDRGQPTHFYPRRNMFLFTVDVPADFGDRELVWTLTTNGKTERAYGSLRTDYLLDRQTIATEMGANFGRIRDEWRTNEFPSLGLAVDQPRRIRVGQPLRLVAFASDDGEPAGNYRPPHPEPGKPHPAYTPPRQIVPGNPAGSAVRLDRLPRGRLAGDFRPDATEDVAGHARLLQLGVVAALHPSSGTPGRPLGGGCGVR